jgi:hypothetical protein
VTLRGLMALGHFADEGEEGEVHGDDDGADGDAEEADHDRLDERQQAGDGRIHLLLVEVGDLAEHGVERARLLADADHLRDHVGEDLRSLQGLDHRLAALDPVAHLPDRVFEDDVAGGAGRDLQGLEDGHARREQRRERAREARDRNLAQDAAEDGQLEHERVEQPAPLRRAVVELDADDRPDDGAEDDEPADAGEEVADADDDAGGERELFARPEQPREDALERGDDEDHDDGDHRRRDDDDRRRVDERRDDIAPELDDLLDVGRKALEDEVEDAARLARLDHVDEELVEDLRVAGHRRGERRALLHVLPRLRQHHREVLVVLLLREDFEALDERQARVDHHRELAREDGEVFGLDLLAPAAELRDGDLAPLLLDGGEHDLLAPQELAQHVAAVGHPLADDHLAEPVPTFEDVSGHELTPSTED